MDNDLIQLVVDDDDQLLEVPSADAAIPEPDPPPQLPLPPVSSIHPPASTRVTGRAPAVVRSQPPSYRASNRCQPSRPIGGSLRIGLVATSLLLIIISAISICFAVLGIIYCSTYANVAHGIWTPVVCVLLGVSNICLVRMNTDTVAKVSLVLSLWLVVCAGNMTGLSLAAAIIDSQPPQNHDQQQNCLRHDLNVKFLSSLVLTLCAFSFTVLSIANIVMAGKVVHKITRLQRSTRAYFATNYSFYYSASDQQVSGLTASAAPPPYSLPEYSPRQQPPPYKYERH